MNSIMIIHPYMEEGVWMFDDEKKGLIKEPFVSGIPEIINLLVKDIKAAKNGFNLYFSEKPFPGNQMKLTHIKEEFGGNWYKLDNNMEGWLCPALFKYFKVAPKEIYVKAE